jgi:hypothetical protein
VLCDRALGELRLLPLGNEFLRRQEDSRFRLKAMRLAGGRLGKEVAIYRQKTMRGIPPSEYSLAPNGGKEGYRL